MESQFKLRDETGADLSDSVAKTVTKLLKTLPQKIIKVKLVNNKTPGNCENLITPILNAEVWSLLNTRVKRKEAGAQKVQIRTVKPSPCWPRL